MELLSSKVPRALETKARIFGFELGDLLLIFLYLSVSNLFFGATRLKLPIVWIGTASLVSFLYFVKRGKPDHYLQHYGEYLRNAHILSAASPDLKYVPFPPLNQTPVAICEEEYEKAPSAIRESG